jgi:hypothetical protein
MAVIQESPQLDLMFKFSLHLLILSIALALDLSTHNLDG